MKYEEKITFLKNYLSVKPENHRDTFKSNVIYYFNDDFKKENTLLLFLKKLDNESEIISFIDSLNSSIILKFDEEDEQIGDFIHEYILQGI